MTKQQNRFRIIGWRARARGVFVTFRVKPDVRSVIVFTVITCCASKPLVTRSWLLFSVSPIRFQIGIKGNPTGINRRLDCDVLVAEVRERAACWFALAAPPSYLSRSLFVQQTAMCCCFDKLCKSALIITSQSSLFRVSGEGCPLPRGSTSNCMCAHLCKQQVRDVVLVARKPQRVIGCAALLNHSRTAEQVDP